MDCLPRSNYTSKLCLRTSTQGKHFSGNNPLPTVRATLGLLTDILRCPNTIETKGCMPPHCNTWDLLLCYHDLVSCPSISYFLTPPFALPLFRVSTLGECVRLGEEDSVLPPDQSMMMNHYSLLFHGG